MPDEELARRLGRTLLAIATRRLALGIVSFSRKSGSRAGIPRGRLWTAKEDAPLGKLPDSEISLRLGRTLNLETSLPAAPSPAMLPPVGARGPSTINY